MVNLNDISIAKFVFNIENEGARIAIHKVLSLLTSADVAVPYSITINCDNRDINFIWKSDEPFRGTVCWSLYHKTHPDSCWMFGGDLFAPLNDPCIIDELKTYFKDFKYSSAVPF